MRAQNQLSPLSPACVGEGPGRPGKLPGPLHYAGDPETRGGFRSYLIEFIDWTQAMHYSATTIKNRRIEMGYFINWCEERGVCTPIDVTRAMLERYRQFIFAYRRKAGGQPLSCQTQGKPPALLHLIFAPFRRHPRIDDAARTGEEAIHRLRTPGRPAR